MFRMNEMFTNSVFQDQLNVSAVPLLATASPDYQQTVPQVSSAVNCVSYFVMLGCRW